MSTLMSLLEERKSPPRKDITTITVTEATPYGRAVLDNQCAVMAATQQGSRDATLLKIGRLVGGFVAGGELPYQLAHDQLYNAAIETGLTAREAGKVSRHLDFGMRDPLRAPKEWVPGQPVEIPHRSTNLRDHLLTASGICNLPDPVPLIYDVLDQGTTALLYGKWGTTKSFIALDWACCVATGKPWQGRPVTQQRVLYVVGEGVSGFKSRVKAWQLGWQQKIGEEQLSFLPFPVNLSRDDEVQTVCDIVSEEGFGFIIFDTLARCMAGVEENSARDTGLVVNALTSIVRATPGGRGVALGVHHTGKDGKTIRGSSSFESAADNVYFAERDGQATIIRCTKRKDGPEGDQHTLKLSDIDGSDSCIVESTRLDVFTESTAAKLDELFAAFFEDIGVSNSELRALAEEYGMSRSAYYNARAELIKRGKITSDKPGNNPFLKRCGTPEI